MSNFENLLNQRTFNSFRQKECNSPNSWCESGKDNLPARIIYNPPQCPFPDRPYPNTWDHLCMQKAFALVATPLHHSFE